MAFIHHMKTFHQFSEAAWWHGFAFAKTRIVMSMDEVLMWLQWVSRAVRGYLASATHRLREEKTEPQPWKSAVPSASPGESSEII